MYTKEQLAKRLGVSKTDIAKYVRAGMPYWKLDNGIGFDYYEVIGWLKQNNLVRYIKPKRWERKR